LNLELLCTNGVCWLPKLFLKKQQMFINSGLENVTYTWISRTRENHETIIQEIDELESELLLI